MILNAMVLDADVTESRFYDQGTGAAKDPSYSVKLTVLDVDTTEKYECRLSDGLPGLDEIKELRRQGQPADVILQAVDQLRAQLPPKMTVLPLEVLKLSGKSAAFIRLVCRFPRVPASV